MLSAILVDVNVNRSTGVACFRDVSRQARSWANGEVAVRDGGELPLQVRAFVEAIPAGTALEEVVAARVREATGTGAYPVRGLVHAMLTHPVTAAAGSLGAGIIADRMGLAELAMRRFYAVPAGVWRRHAPDEYLRCAFRVDPRTGLAAIEELLADRHTPVPQRSLLEAARLCLAAGRPRLAERILDRCTDGAEPSWLRSWVDPPPEPAVTGVSVAVLGYDSPARPATEPALADRVQTLAAFAHLVRHPGVRLHGAAGLTALAGAIRQRDQAGSATGTVTLTAVSRDGSVHERVPVDTWLLACGTYGADRSAAPALPFHPNLRPILVSFSMHRRLLSPAVREQLLRYGPVGCRDWSTVDLLLSAGIPAFFSGCLTTGLGSLFPGENAADIPESAGIHGRLASDLAGTIALFDAYRRTGFRVTTGDPQVHLAARAAGLRSDLRPADPADPALNGLRDLDDEAVTAMATALRDLLEAPIRAILSGRPPAEVYALWRRSCQPHVAAARRRRNTLPRLPALSFDLAAVCARSRERALHVPARAPRGTGPAVHVALTFDARLAHEARVALEAIVSNTAGPLHLWLLTRDHGAADWARVAGLFPEAASSWLPVDEVDYGPVPSLLAHATTSSLDRLLLPELLPDVPRVVYQDVDALALGDLGELAAWDLGSAPLAACDATSTRSGFINVYHAAGKLPDRPELAYELIRRAHARHRFDFTGFNSGVMVLDLDRMRRDRFCTEFLPYVQRYGMVDQQVLNCYAGPDRAVLPGVWNARPTREFVTDPKVIHWVGAQKPWNPEYVLFKEVWQEYADRLAKRAEVTGDPDE